MLLYGQEGFRMSVTKINSPLLTWFLVDENDGLTGRNGTVVGSFTSALWFWVANQTNMQIIYDNNN